MIRRRTSPRRAAGFTLLEMMAVILIMGMLFTFVVPGLGFTAARAVDEQARRLAADLEFARQRTVMTQVAHRVVLDLDRGSWQLEWAPPPDEEPAEGEREDAQVQNAPLLDLAPPRQTVAAYEPLPAGTGRRENLSAGVWIAWVETPEGSVDTGQVEVAFEHDGTADPTSIGLEGDDGERRVVLEIQPLSDAVRIHDAS